MSVAASSTKQESQPRLSSKRVNLIIAVFVVSAMIMILNETILSVALPTIMEDFNVGADVVQWLSTGFMLVMAIVIPTTGFLLQRFGTRSLFLTALILFTVGTVVAAVAPAFAWILLGRVIQAIGTAIVLPLLMTVTLSLVEPERRGMMMGVNSIVMSVAPAVGPTLSGLILNSLTWHWLFWLMVPIALICLVAGFFLIVDIAEPRKIGFDVLSVVLSALAFGGLIYGLSTIGQLATGESWIPLVALIVGAVFLAVFVRRQIVLSRSGKALLEMAPFGVLNFTLSVIVLSLAFATMLGTVIVLPLYMQSALLITALVTGLALLPGGLIQGVVSPFIGRIYDSVGPRPLVIPGTLILLASQVWMHFGLTENTSVWTVVAMYVVFGIGMALVMTPMMTLSLSVLPKHLYGHGSAIVNTLQQLGGAAGTAILIAAMTIGAQNSEATSMAGAQADGTASSFIAGGILAAIAVVASQFIHAPERTKVVAQQEPQDA
ncbi:MDR family MFS transporter [Corynebacterium callunae]|uniref:MDR family MFS transporter n=1 Tax=Corynebacterium callunae TaxID=1721 RepID=UPI003982CFEC